MLRRVPLGLRYMVLAAFFFSVMSLLVKVAGQRLPGAEIVFARNLFSLVVTYVMLRRAGVGPWGRRKGLLVVRGLVGLVALLCFYYALTKLPLADATVIQYTNPVFTALLAALFLREHMGAAEVGGTLLSLAGVLLVAQPSFLFGARAASLDLFAVGVGLAGAFLAAVAYTTVRKLRETEHPLVVVFYFPLVATPGAVPVMAPNALWPQGWEWLVLLGVGITTQIAQVYMTKGLHLERAGRATAISYVQIVFAAAWGFLFFGEHLDPLTLAGAALVVLGALAASRR